MYETWKCSYILKYDYLGKDESYLTVVVCVCDIVLASEVLILIFYKDPITLYIIARYLKFDMAELNFGGQREKEALLATAAYLILYH